MEFVANDKNKVYHQMRHLKLFSGAFYCVVLYLEMFTLQVTSSTAPYLCVSAQIHLCLLQEQYQFLYKALEMFFPVQNGEVKASAAVQIVNETKAAEQPAEERAEEPASTTSIGQQGAEGAPTVADGEKEEKKEKPEKVSGTPTETTPLEDTSNGPGVTVEVWGGWPGLSLLEISASTQCFVLIYFLNV